MIHDKFHGKRTICHRAIVILSILVCIAAIYALKSANSSRYADVSGPGGSTIRVHLVDYGSKPCKCQAKPAVYEELEKEYASRVLFEYVDITAAAKKGILALPTQIFYDVDHHEIGRLEGPASEDAISNLLDDILAHSTYFGITPTAPDN